MKEAEQNDEGPRSEAAYPAYDLGEALRVAEAVRDLGGGNVPVPRGEIAKHLEYAENGPSFFQRVAAARSFGVIAGRGSYSLTEIGKEYFYPTIENGQKIAGVKMLSFPKSFNILVKKFDGLKLPGIEMLGNIMHSTANVPLSKKSILAGCFIRSAQAIGVMDTSGVLSCKPFEDVGKKVSEGIASGKIPKEVNLDNAPEDLKSNDQNSKSDQHTIYLSADKQRMVKLVAPLTISNAEYQRICNWIKVALIV